MHDKWDGTNLTYFLHGSDIFFSVDKEGWHDDGFMILRLVQNNISPHQLRQFTTVSWSRHLTFCLTDSPLSFPAAGAVVGKLALVRVPLRDPGQLLVPHLQTNYQIFCASSRKIVFMGLRSGRCLPVEICHWRKMAQFSEFKFKFKKLLRNRRNKLWTIVKTIATKTYYSVDKINSQFTQKSAFQNSMSWWLSNI